MLNIKKEKVKKKDNGKKKKKPDIFSDSLFYSRNLQFLRCSVLKFQRTCTFPLIDMNNL